MSRQSSPGHSSPDSYDSSQYDPTFAAEITSKMRVPDKICVIEGVDPPDYNFHHTNSELKSRMNVPERILVAGDNKHIAVREAVPELKFDTPFPIHLPNLVLAPPPNVLTVDEYPYPSADVKQGKTEMKTTYAQNQDLEGTIDLHETSLNSTLNPEEDLTKLRIQMRHLSRRVLAIEQENQQRQQREIVLYAIGISYIFIKSLLWFHRHF